MKSKKTAGTCTYEDILGDKCIRTLHDNEHCIFHSKNKGKEEKFYDAFRKELKRQEKEEEGYNLEGFVFLGNNSFESFVFEKDVFCNRITFEGGALFNNVVFRGAAIFSDGTFGGEVKFDNTTFLQHTGFNNVTFKGNAGFKNTTFIEGAIFLNAKFEKDAGFGHAKIKGGASFNSATFNGNTGFDFATFEGDANFYDATFKGKVDFWRTTFKGNTGFLDATFNDISKINMIDTYFYDVNGLLEMLNTKENKKARQVSKYKTEFLSKNVKIILGEMAASKYPIIVQQINDDRFLIKYQMKHPILYSLWSIFANCGRSLGLWALWSLVFALIFAGIYFQMGPEAFNMKGLPFSRETMIYYSVVTFTTLGFGDITPNTVWAARWVIAEVITGYIMLGGLISILANKLARRS